MICDFYYRFYKLTRSKGLSILLSYAARFVFFLRYLVKKVFTAKQIINMSEAEAINFIRSVSPDPEGKPDYSSEPLQPGLDLSVIVPVYNHIDATAKCIESILKQKTQCSYELILIDDGSTDGAQDMIETYNDRQNVRIYHQSNGGIGAARNAGISRARGRYLMFVDCDDAVRPDIVETLMHTAYEKDSDIVMGAHNLLKMTNGTVTKVIPNIESERNLLGYKNGDEIMNYAGLPWAKVYKRELFENIRFFPGYWYEDTIIHGLLFLRCDNFTYVPHVVYDYVWNEENFSHIQHNTKQGKPKTADRYWLIAAIANRCEELGLPLDARFYTMLLKHVSAYYYNTISAMPDEFIDAMFIAARSLLLKYKPSEKVKLPYMLRQTEKAMIDCDIALWKLCSVNQ